MKNAACARAVLLCLVFGCSDRATIGGLCRDPCAVVDASSHDACTGADCRADAVTSTDAGIADAGSDAGPVCREGAFELTRMRLDLLFVIDDTASVAPWLPALYDGFGQFIHEKASDGLGVGFQRFDEICEPEAYTKLIVPIAPLPGNAGPLMDAAQLVLSASTSTTPALDGVLRHARDWNAHADSHVAVVLMTDGSPGACDGLVGDWDAEAQRLAREALQGTPSIKTYVVGFGTMDAPISIARAGGTQPALINVTPADGEVKLALDNVRADAQPCAFKLPSGWKAAPASEVVVTATNDARHRYPIHADSSACAQQDGFYIADPTAAYPLIACPRSCASLVAGDSLALSAACVAE
jgi:hypothetical protein